MRRAYVIVALLVSATLAVASGEDGAAGAGTASAAAVHGGHVSRRDVRATKRHVEAQYAYERAWRSSAPAAKAGLRALVQRVEGECPGVVAGALKGREWAVVQDEVSGLSARERGEANRWARQRVELQAEVSTAVQGALLEPTGEAALAFARTTESLRWTSATVTRYEHADASRLDWEAGAQAVDVCADMRAWAQSGYTTISSATNALIEEDQASIDAFGLDILTGGRPSLGSFEDAHSRRLAGQAAQIQQRRGNLEVAAEARLERALGLIDREEQLGYERLEHPAKGSVVLQRGRTAAGGRPMLPRGIGGGRKVPGGPRFAFGGLSDPPVSGRVVLEVEGEGFNGPGFFAPFADGGRFRVEPANRKLRAKPFDVTVYLGCRPHEYAIVYGVLEEVQDRVLARGGGRLVRLQRVRIPASLHMHGALVYAALPSVPSEILVRSSAGRTVLMKRLTHGVQEARETCEGEAEPGR